MKKASNHATFRMDADTAKALATLTAIAGSTSKAIRVALLLCATKEGAYRKACYAYATGQEAKIRKAVLQSNSVTVDADKGTSREKGINPKLKALRLNREQREARGEE